VVARNSLRGTVVVSDPPTTAPSRICHVRLVSPSQPANDFPSNSGTGPAASVRDEVTKAAKAIAADSERGNFMAENCPFAPAEVEPGFSHR
jgi:hypothetical protein